MPKSNTSDSNIASLRQQNEEYNELYRKWRMENKSVGFFHRDSELAYSNENGFMSDHPAVLEKNALDGVHTILSQTLIFHTILEIIVFMLFSDLSFSISDRVFISSGGYFFGDDYITVFVSSLVNVIVKAVPMIFMLMITKIPLRICFPMKITNKPLFGVSVPIAMLAYGIGMCFSGAQSGLEKLIGIDQAHTIWIPKSTNVLMVDAVIMTMLLPALSELIHRGIIMQLLRQFGDGYALIITSAIAAFTIDADSWLFIFFYSLIIGYFTMRSGSILTAIVMRWFFSMSSFWLTYFRMVLGNSDAYLTISMVIAIAYIIIGITLITGFALRHSNKITLPMSEVYMSQKEKLLCCLTNPWVIVWAALAIVNVMIRKILT